MKTSLVKDAIFAGLVLSVYVNNYNDNTVQAANNDTVDTESHEYEWSFHLDEYKNNAPWLSTPMVLVCNDSNIDFEDIKMATDFWTNHDHEFRLVMMETDAMPCIDEFQQGTIQFQGERGNVIPEKEWAASLRKVSTRSRSMIAVNIETTKDSSGIWEVAIHELGHALGYLHHDDPTDVLYRRHAWKN